MEIREVIRRWQAGISQGRIVADRPVIQPKIAVLGQSRVWASIAPLDLVVWAGATSYEVEQNGRGWQNVGTVSAHTVTGLENGTTYVFRLRAVNGALVGDPSAAVDATPDAETAPPGPHPNAPAWLRVEPGYSDYGGQVTLTWDAVPNAEGYECQSGEDSDDDADWWDEFPHCPTTGTSATLDAYSQTSYDFRVRAWRTIDDVRYYSGWKDVRLNHWDWPRPGGG